MVRVGFIQKDFGGISYDCEGFRHESLEKDTCKKKWPVQRPKDRNVPGTCEEQQGASAAFEE